MRRLPANPSSRRCHQPTVGSPTRQHKSTSSPWCRAGKSTSPVPASLTSTPSDESSVRHCSSSPRTSAGLDTPGPALVLWPLPAALRSAATRSRAIAPARAASSTIRSASGRTRARALLASEGVNVRSATTRLPHLRVASTPAAEIFLWSRVLLWGAAALALAWFPARHGASFGTGLWVRWDSGWLLRIAHHGYASDPPNTDAFFPLYPALTA